VTWLYDWWIFRDVDATGIEIAASGDEGYLIIHTRSRFKRVIAVTVDRAELLGLAGMIREAEPDDLMTGLLTPEEFEALMDRWDKPAEPTAEPAGGAR
jgi:hypothetical protein